MMTTAAEVGEAPMEAVLGLIRSATARAAQSMESEEAVLLSVVDELEGIMEADDADIDDVLRKLTPSKSQKALAMLAG
eukprot:scaffold219780_cov39-Prasinocladus_malaysianus.AAC.1